jgi:hypothetical protein
VETLFFHFFRNGFFESVFSGRLQDPLHIIAPRNLEVKMLRTFCLNSILVGGLCLAAAPSLQAQEGDRPARGQGGPGGGRMGGRMGGGMGMMGGGGGFMGLLRMKEVTEELKLDADQTKEIETLNEEGRAMFLQMRGNGGPPSGPPDMAKMQEMMAKMQESTTKMEAKLEEVLDPNQMDRLLGLFVQQQGAMSLNHSMVATKLNVTAEQKAKMAEMAKEGGEAIGKLFSNGPNPEAMEKMQSMRKEGEEKILAMLTAEQKKSMEDMKGAEFKFPERQWGGPGGRGGRGSGGGRGGNGGGSGEVQ